MQSTVKIMLLVSMAVYASAAPDVSNFGYAVSDPITGDHKDQQEIRAGDAVSGYYRTLDADGLMRTVNYKADPLNGFKADVDRSPAGIARAAAVAPVVTAPMAAAPLVAPANRASILQSAAMPAVSIDPISGSIMSVNPFKSTTLLSDGAQFISPNVQLNTAAAPAVMWSSAGPSWNMWHHQQPYAAAVLQSSTLTGAPLAWSTPIIKK